MGARWLLAGTAAAACLGQSPQTPPAAEIGPPVGSPPLSLAQSVAQNEIAIIQQQGQSPIRYRQRTIDARSDRTREVIETTDGAVARLVERNGRPLSAAEDAAERARLNLALANPEEFHRHHRHDSEMRDYGIGLVKLMPTAMIYTYAPGQPQPPGVDSPQLVVDFHPNPGFHPPNMVANLLTGLEGRLWIDPATRTMTRCEGRILRPVNFGWGVVAHIFPGGTVELEQTRVNGGRWVYSHMEEHLSVRELMFKTQLENTQITSSEFHLLPHAIGYQEAIRLLLATSVPVR